MGVEFSLDFLVIALILAAIGFFELVIRPRLLSQSFEIEISEIDYQRMAQTIEPLDVEYLSVLFKNAKASLVFENSEFLITLVMPNSSGDEIQYDISDKSLMVAIREAYQVYETVLRYGEDLTNP